MKYPKSGNKKNIYKIDIRDVWHNADEIPEPEKEILVETYDQFGGDVIRFFESRIVPNADLLGNCDRNLGGYCRCSRIIQWCYLDDIFYRI